MSTELPLIASPCISVCLLDEQQVCMGCFRTADEIGRWTQLTDAERARVMNELGARASNYGASD